MDVYLALAEQLAINIVMFVAIECDFKYLLSLCLARKYLNPFRLGYLCEQGRRMDHHQIEGSSEQEGGMKQLLPK